MDFKNKKLFFVCLLVTLSVLPLTFILDFTTPNASALKINFSSALEVNYPNIFGLRITQRSSLPEYARYFFNLGMGIAGLLALTVITIGGVHYLIAFAGGGFRDNGKEWIKSGIVGLVILLSSYLIAYTINPDLVVFRLERLFPFLSRVFNNTANPPENQPPISYYEEIPLGILTENLVSRTKDCYDFDPDGNPIEGDEARSGRGTINLPTYLDHDRADCLLKLTDATQKKAKLIKDLSDEIIELMQQCSCQNKCDLTCDTCAYTGPCPAPNPNAEGLCGGNCVGAGCQGENDCCPPGVRDKIQGIGEATIDITDCVGNVKKYRGLEEFRTTMFNVSSLIESRVRVSGRMITIINMTRWQNLKLIEQLMYLEEKIAQIRSEIQLDLDNLEAAKTSMSMAYCYSAKSSADFLKIKESTENDKKTIEPQRTFIDPIVEDYVDSSKYCKGFNYSNSSCFKTCQDRCPDSSIQAASRYADCGECDEDNRGYAACLARQQACVERAYNERPCTFSISQEDDDFASCIESCKDDCLDNCRERYLNYSECPPGSCLGSDGACSPENCDADYSPTRCDHYDQFRICQNQCNNNSECILDNQEECLVSGKGFQGCASQNNDPGNLEACIDNNYLCKYGSNEYAGYPDCLRSRNPNDYSSSYIFENPNLLKCPNPYQILPEEGTQAYCQEIFKETTKCPPNSKCPECPCGLIDETIVFSNNDNGCPPGYCRDIDGGCSLGNCVDDGGQNESEEISIPVEKNVLVAAECSEFAYDNDPLTFYCRTDWEPEAPLSGKWSDCSMAEEIPVGQTVDDSIEWAIDLIEKTNSFDEMISEMLTYMKKIGDKNPDEYCKCNSKYDVDNEDQTKAGKPICASNCQYTEATIPYPSNTYFSNFNLNECLCPGGVEGEPSCYPPCSGGGVIGGCFCPGGVPGEPSCYPPCGGASGCLCLGGIPGEPSCYPPCSGGGGGGGGGGYLSCFCSIVPCLGNPCQQMIEYLSKISELHKKIRQGFIDFYIYFISEERTDILKELTYSRKEMNSCSQQVVKKGEETTKTINCTRAYGNNFLNKRCYGFLEGQTKTPKEDLTDNWFCCKEALK